MLDVEFKLIGKSLPADHGYHLLSAVSRVLPSIHGDESVGLHPVSGAPNGNRLISLSPKSALKIRIDSGRVREVLPLAGQRLDVGGHPVSLGAPQTRALVPAARLYSRLVVIKGFMEPEEFLAAARRQLAQMDVKADASLVPQPQIAEANADSASGARSPFLRRTLRIRDKNVVGFAVMVDGLSAEESILLQEKGLGGRRRFGCGIFIPDRR